MRRFGCRHLGHKAALVHHVDAVGDAQQLGHLRRDHDHAFALGRHLGDEGVDLVLGSHVDAACGLVQDQHFGVGEKPFGQHHLLLVTARQVERLLVHPGAAQAQLVAVVLRHLVLFAVVDHARGGHPLQVGQRDVELDVFVQHQPIALAVFGHIGQTVLHGFFYGADIDGLAVAQHLAADAAAPRAAKQAHRQLGAARAHEPGDADDLAAPHLQVNAFDEGLFVALGVVGAPVTHLKRHFADVRLALRVAVGHLAAHHGPDDAVLAHLLGVAVEHFNRAAIAQHRDGVGHVGDFIELVRNQDAGDALAFELQQQLQQGVAVGFVQAGRGLVQDQQLDLARQGLGNFDQLLLAHAQVGDEGVGRLFESDLVQQGLRHLVRRHPVDHAALGGLVAQEDVFGDGQEGHQGQLLVDDGHAQMFAVADALELALFPLKHDGAAVAAVGVDAREHFHQRGFARAVFAHDGVDFTGAHLQVDPVQGNDAREGFADIPHL